MFENSRRPLASKKIFFHRILICAALAGALTSVSLFIGILGYHYFENLSWLDSLLNASMILTGMGPVNEVKTVGGKIFASFYAIFAGTFYLVTASI